MKTLSTGKKITLLIFLILLVDQVIKIWVKTNMAYGDEIFILGQDWARIHFVENKGMAFGIELGGELGKLALSLFRILAIGMLIYLVKRLIEDKEKFGLVVCFAMILAGAIGNMIDSSIYSLIFSASRPYSGEIAQFLPSEGGYGTFLHGNVVDMFHFPMVNTHWPEWVPKVGGQRFEFFRPVFNFADASISLGVATIFLLYRSFFSQKTEEKQTVEMAINEVNKIQEEK